LKVYFKKFNPGIDSIIPLYQTEDAAGMDLSSASIEPVELNPGEIKLIPTNLILEIPKGFECQVRPRSGLALKHGITVLNSPGTIDSDYRGEVKVLLINHGKEKFIINFGERIAQLIFHKYEKADLIPAQKLSDTNRGDGGYGSTGK
jgi:dUTP pyrophosphatase